VPPSLTDDANGYIKNVGDGGGGGGGGGAGVWEVSLIVIDELVRTVPDTDPLLM
jgi:hypothetical protein